MFTRVYPGYYTGTCDTVVDGAQTIVSVEIRHIPEWSRGWQWSITITTHDGSTLIEANDVPCATLADAKRAAREMLAIGWYWYNGNGGFSCWAPNTYKNQ